MSPSRLALASVGLLTACLLAIRAGTQPAPAATPVEAPVADQGKPRSDKQPRLDAFGDPLPEGAVARLGTLRWYPGTRAQAVAFAPDGKALATGGEDHKVRLWETATGKELRVFACQGSVAAVTFVPGASGKPGTLLAAGGRDPKVRLWDVATGKAVAEFDLPAGVKALAASADGKLLAAGMEQEIVVWNVAGGKKVRQWIPHGGGVLSLAFTPDGKGLLSGGRSQEPLTGSTIRLGPGTTDDYALALWDPLTGQLTKKFAEHNAEARVLGFTADGQRWVTAGAGNEGWGLGIWDATFRRRQEISLKDIDRSLEFFALAPDGKTVAASGGREVLLWGLASGKRLPSITQGTEYLPQALAFSPDSRALAASAVLRRVTLWDVARRAPRQVFAAHEQAVLTVAVAPDGKTAMTGGGDGAIREWDLATGKPLRALTHPGSTAPLIQSARYSPDGKLLAVSYFHGVSVWDVARGQMIQNIPAPPGKGRIVSFDFAPDGTKLVWQCIDDAELHLWDLKAGMEARRFAQGEGGCYFLAYSPAGDTIASVVTSRLSLWEAGTGKELYRQQRSGHYLTFSPDGLLLALYSEPIRILEAATGAELVLCHSTADGWYSLGEVSWKTKQPGEHHGKALSSDLDGC